MAIGSDLPLDEKTQGSGRDDFQSYFDRFPAAVDEFVAFARELFPSKLAPQLPALVHSWAHGMGIDNHPILTNLIPPVAPTRKAKKQFALVERRWMELGTLAPVAIATMVFQENSDMGDYVVPVTDDPATNRIKWEVSFGILRIPPGERNLSCVPDSYESDVHRDDESAPQKAQDWEGPFLVRVDLFEPSEHLKSLRQDFWMSRTLPAGADAPKKSGPRL